LNNSQAAGITVRGNEYPYYSSIDGLTFIYKPYVRFYEQVMPGESYWLYKSAGVWGGWSKITKQCEKGTLAEGADVKLKIVVQGNKYTAYVNDTEWCSYVADDKAESSEKQRWVGLFLDRSGQSFDNFTITSLGGSSISDGGSTATSDTTTVLDNIQVQQVEAVQVKLLMQINIISQKKTHIL